MMFSKPFFTAAILAAIASVVSADTKCTGRTGKVNSGDTCDIISGREKVSFYQLLLFNPWINKDCSNLVGGQSLCLSMKGVDCTGDNLYEVQSTDKQGCWGIANDHHISLDIFMANNGNPDCTKLRVGEWVCVAADKIPYPTK